MSTFRDNLAKTINVPRKALRFVVGTDIAMEQSTEVGKKVHIKARAKEPVQHPYFGKVIHDFSTMTINKRIAIDHEHGTEIGYAKNFSITSYGLELDGIIFENKGNAQHPANAVIFNLTNAIPQEASIDFSGTYDVEEVGSAPIMVNGIAFSNGIVIRNWTLKAVAICKLGADPNTEAVAQFTESDVQNPTNMEQFMIKPEEPSMEPIAVPEEAPIKVEVELPDVEPATDIAEVPAQESMPTPPVAEGTPQVVDQAQGEEVKAPAITTDEAMSMIEQLRKTVCALEEQVTRLTGSTTEMANKYKSVMDSLGEEPVKVFSNVATKFTSWKECVQSVQKGNLSWEDAHVTAMKMYPEFHKTQIIKAQ